MELIQRVEFLRWLIANEDKLGIYVEDDARYYFEKWGVVPNFNEMICYDYKEATINALYKDYLLELIENQNKPTQKTNLKH